MAKKIEMVEVTALISARNRFKVPLKQWRKWSALARSVFNNVFTSMTDQSVITNPSGPKMTAAQWRTVRWNAAWLAADAVKEARA